MSAPDTTDTDTAPPDAGGPGASGPDAAVPEPDRGTFGMTRTGWLLAVGGCAVVVGGGGWAGATFGQIPAPAVTTASTAQHDTSGQGGTAGQGGGMAGMHGMGAPGSVELWAVQSGSAADVVTDGSGRMLYRSAADGTSPPASRCVGACAQEWQPVTVTAGKRPETLGVADRSVGTLTRPDGAVQVTLAGAPLYTHRGDTGQLDAPVDVGGWYAVAPNGGKAGPDGS